MRIRGFILGVLLLALVGWCMVHETMKQTQARYVLAEVAREENEMLKRLEKLRAKEESLLQPSRLAALARELKLDVASLGTVPPSESSLSPAPTMASRRQHGETSETAREGIRVAVVGAR